MFNMCFVGEWDMCVVCVLCMLRVFNILAKDTHLLGASCQYNNYLLVYLLKLVRNYLAQYNQRIRIVQSTQIYPSCTASPTSLTRSRKFLCLFACRTSHTKFICIFSPGHFILRAVCGRPIELRPQACLDQADRKTSPVKYVRGHLTCRLIRLFANSVCVRVCIFPSFFSLLFQHRQAFHFVCSFE